MNCSNPVIILKPGLPGHPMKQVPGSPAPYLFDNLVVPCGKCIACVKARQDNFACRVRAEADKKGCLSFLTLTYREDSLPLVSTLWRISKDTGEYQRLTEPDFVCYSRKEDFYSYRDEMAKVCASSRPRFLDSIILEDADYVYLSRITPSVCRKDVQIWLKTCRNWLKKEGYELEWSYAICSEYGPRTCRPHYHCCLFGLPHDVVEQFSRLWKFGFTDVRHVERVNPDGSDGFSRVADYVGKYVSKGVFECESVKCGAAFGTRMMSSKALGSQIVEKFRPYVLAQDMIGAEYDLDTFFIPSKNRYLSRSELISLSSEIPKRLSISFDGKRYFAFPRVLRNKIFYVEKKSEKGNVTYYRPSRLWKMVVDAISKQYADLHQQEFEQFLSGYDKRKISEAVSQFNLFQESASGLADSIRKSHYQSKLSKSKL